MPEVEFRRKRLMLYFATMIRRKEKKKSQEGTKKRERKEKESVHQKKPNLTSTPLRVIFNFPPDICAGRERRRSEQLSKFGIKKIENHSKSICTKK